MFQNTLNPPPKSPAQLTFLIKPNAMINYQITANDHWVDTWWANGDVSPSQMAVVDRLDLKISDYIKSKAI